MNTTTLSTNSPLLSPDTIAADWSTPPEPWPEPVNGQALLDELA